MESNSSGSGLNYSIDSLSQASVTAPLKGPNDNIAASNDTAKLDDGERDGTDTPYSCDGWVESAIKISVPCGLKDNGGLGRPFLILEHCSLLAVMKAALADVTARQFHFSPFERIWKSRREVLQ